MLNRKEFTKIMAGLFELYNKELSEFILDIYYQAFKDCTLEQFRNGINKCLLERKYNSVPKPAEIIEKIEGKQEDRALLAWTQVIEAIRKHGYYETVIFQDKTIHKVIEHLGGWVWLCEQSKDELKFIAKDFYRLYPVLKNAPRKAPEKLIGFIEQRNSAKGLEKHIPEPKLIGYERKLINKEKR